jgi:hypothetical protein
LLPDHKCAAAERPSVWIRLRLFPFFLLPLLDTLVLLFLAILKGLRFLLVPLLERRPLRRVLDLLLFLPVPRL